MAGKLNYGTPLNRQPLSWAGGVSTFNDIWGAAYEQLRLVDNSNAAQAALEDAYAARTKAVKEATGVDLGNPIYEAATNIGETEVQRLARGEVGTDPQAPGNRIPREQATYASRLNELAAQHPELADIIRADVPVERDAEAMARAADERLATMMASNPDWTSSVAAFGGGAIASFRDPLVTSTLALGGGPGAARTVFGRVLTVAAKEALLNGGTALAAQPAVQEWRRRAGLDNGFDQAASNVLFAAGLGGVLGGAGAGIGEAVGALGRRAAQRRAVEEFALSRPELGDQARRALSGDTSAASAMLAEIRDQLPPEVRGAIDAAQADAARQAQREAELAHLSARRADDLEARAENAARARELPDLVLDDPARVNRLVRELAPKAESISGELPARNFEQTVAELRSGLPADEAARRPVTMFVSRRLGGVDPEQPIAAELKAVGLDSRNTPGMFRRGGRPALDNIPADELPPEIRTALGAAADSTDGYISERQWLAALDLEQRAPADRNAASIDDHRRHLEEQGIDVDRLSDDDLLQQLADLDSAERRYAAAEPNDLGLRTDEVAIVPAGMTRRAYTAQLVRQVLDRVGAGVGDDVVRMAVDTVVSAGETLDDAIDFALATKVGGRKTLPESEWRELGSEPPVVAKDAPVDPPLDDGEGAIDWAGLDAEPTKIAAPAKGMVRYYHGTKFADAKGFSGKTFLSPQEDYAKNYRGGPNNVLYADFTKEDAIARGIYDEVNDVPINGAINDGAAVLKPFEVASPWDFGARVDFDEWKKTIDEAKWLESVVEACKL